jgi:hypothetical protein
LSANADTVQMLAVPNKRTHDTHNRKQTNKTTTDGRQKEADSNQPTRQSQNQPTSVQ